jgi:hypothetical protein
MDEMREARDAMRIAILSCEQMKTRRDKKEKKRGKLRGKNHRNLFHPPIQLEK